MKKQAFLVGMENATGYQIAQQLVEQDYQVTIGTWGLASSEEYPELSGVSIIHLNPTSDESVDAAKAWFEEHQITVDLLILNIEWNVYFSGTTIDDVFDYEEMKETYEWNTIAPFRVISKFYPLLKDSQQKRICMVTDEVSSVNVTNEIDNYGYAMSIAARNMEFALLFNRLRPEGYSFRVYAKDDEHEDHGIYACHYFLANRSYEPWCLKHSDEERFVMRNRSGMEIPW